MENIESEKSEKFSEEEITLIQQWKSCQSEELIEKIENNIVEFLSILKSE